MKLPEGTWPRGCASNTSQLGSTQPKKPRHKLARQGTPGFPQPPSSRSEKVAKSMSPPLMYVRWNTAEQSHFEPDRYLCAAAGSPQAYNNTDTDQFCLAVEKRVEVWTLSITLEVLLCSKRDQKKDWCRNDATSQWLLFHAFPKWNQVRNVSYWWRN